MTPLYKTVSADGRSIHGGNLQWSLPRGGQPGEWHEVKGVLEKCVRGIHLTDCPAHWWKPGCRVFVAEAEGVIGSCGDDTDRKVVCRRARLLREATAEELDSLRIWSEGHHEVKAGEIAIASGSASVEAWDSARVIASGSASVRASGSASVEAWDSARIIASDSASVKAFDSASVKASGSASVKAFGSAHIEASGSASVKAFGSARIEAWDSARIIASDSASVKAFDSASVKAFGSASVKAFGSARVIASGSARVIASDSASVKAWDLACIEARGSVGIEASGSTTIITWFGSTMVKILDRAVWIERGGGTGAPVVRVATEGHESASTKQTNDLVGGSL